MSIANNLSRIRQRRGLSAVALAKQTGVSRQTIYAMESASYVPNTAVALRLARALDVSVEDLFHLEGEPAASPRLQDVDLLPGDGDVEAGQPLQLCQVDSRIIAASPAPVAWHLPTADAVLLESNSKHTRVQLFQEDTPLENRLLVAGCDPGMSVLARHVRLAGVELVLAHRNSSQALRLLKDGVVHIAGSHLRDEATGESNLPAVRKLFRKGSAAVFSFAMWEEGIVVARGNPKGIRGIADFARKDVCIMNREPGAGSRLLLDTNLQRITLEKSQVRGYDRIALGHLPAAWTVRAAESDACIATRAAARVFGLDFLPLIGERYDLVIRKQHLTLPAVQIVIDTLSRNKFRRELEGLGGYDTSDAGRRIE